MSPRPLVDVVAVVAIAVAASVFDLRSRRIPNALTAGAVLAALAVHGGATGLPGVAATLLGCGLGFALFLPLFLLGGMGAGDVKLLAALGAWLGPAGAAWTALYTAIAGGVLALAVAIARGYLGTAFSNLLGLMAFWRAAGIKPSPALTLEGAAGPRLPYALAIGVGALVTLWRN